MSDEKNKDKALNALKKKFNSGGRVNARRGGRRNGLSFSKEDVNTTQAREFFKNTSKNSSIAELLNFGSSLIDFNFLIFFTKISATFSPR